MRLALHVLNALLALGLIAFSVTVYPELPARVPTHFDIRGEPDAWADRSLLAWLLLPFIGLAICGLLYFVGWLVPKWPKYVNMPDKKKLLELPLQAQRWVLAGVSISMYRTVTVMLIMFTVLQYGAYRAAVQGDGSSQILAGVLIGVLIAPLVSLSSLLLLQRRLDEAWHAWRTGRPVG